MGSANARPLCLLTMPVAAILTVAAMHGCVREVAVGTRPSTASDAGPGEGGTPLTCTLDDCEVIALDTPVCGEYEELACVPEANKCQWQCVIRPLIAGETQCGTAICNGDEFCDAPPGGCDDGPDDRRCVAKPSLCSRELSPVCTCSGSTYDNACEAQRAGMLIARPGECPAPALTPCATECENFPPVEISTPTCPDGALKIPICVENATGGCSWVTRKCEPGTVCPQPPPVTVRGRCWTAADCEIGQSCEGALVCPCDAECVIPDKTGTCR
jgi:hypothetical protein